MKVKFINGNWIDDDVDLLPTIKLRTSSKMYSYYSSTNVKVKATSIALCWLKWGIMISFGKTFKLE